MAERAAFGLCKMFLGEAQMDGRASSLIRRRFNVALKRSFTTPLALARELKPTQNLSRYCRFISCSEVHCAVCRTLEKYAKYADRLSHIQEKSN